MPWERWTQAAEIEDQGRRFPTKGSQLGVVQLDGGVTLDRVVVNVVLHGIVDSNWRNNALYVSPTEGRGQRMFWVDRLRAHA